MTDLAKRRAELIAWAQSCLDSGDRHGLRDAAADLEVIEARMEERAQPRRLPVSEVFHTIGKPYRTERGTYYENCGCPDCVAARG